MTPSNSMPGGDDGGKAKHRVRPLSMLRFCATLPLLFVATFPLWILHRLLLRSADPARRLLVPLWWHSMALFVLGLRLRTEGQVSRRRPLLVVANHVSWTDICLLGSVVPGSFVAKAEMASWPGLSILARITRTIFVDRSDRRASARQAQQIGERLSAGEPILLFPEGTTSAGSDVLPFKSSLLGSVRLALAQAKAAADKDGEAGGETAEMAVQPAAIAYRRRGGRLLDAESRAAHAAWIGDAAFGPHFLSIVTGPPLDVTIRFGPPLIVSTMDDRKALTRRLEGEVGALLRQTLDHRATDGAEGRSKPDG